MQTIEGYQFDIRGSPVYLLHPGKKFWEATIYLSTVKYRVGKIRDGIESNVEEVQKDYHSTVAAETAVTAKIRQKLTKGYYSETAKKTEQKKQTEVIKKAPENKKNSKGFSGEYYEKDGEGIKMEVNNKRVKVTRIDKDKKQKYEIRSFPSHEDAVDFCLKEQDWNKSEGYKAMNHKFIYSFVDDAEDEQKQQKKPTRKKEQKSKANGNNLSITDMTDDAISHRSRNNSPAHSDRSYGGDSDEGNGYAACIKLGSPTSGCIKVLLAETYQEQLDPTGWIMSEKLDGVRCFWTGTQMFSRNANRFYFPKFFTKNWPKCQLDGQLFIGRGQFSKTLSAVKKNVPINSEWENVRYLVFDCPGLKKPFKDRIKALKEVLSEIDNPYIKCHAHRECTGFPDLFDELDRVNKIEGEGLMLRQPNSYYENRRSKSLLKVKTFYDDEATVLGYKEGTGRCQGMVGALKCRNTHGVQFEVGSGLTDAERRRPPKIGSKITYKYQQFNKDSGKPRFPTYMRAYDDKI